MPHSVWWCGATLLVTLLGIYSKLKAHSPAWLPQHPAATCHPIPSQRLVGPSFIFQQCNGPKHTSRLCKGYLTKKESDGVLCQMTWLPQSPDLNLIEMVWDEMDRRVKAKGSKSAQHLPELLQDCWKTISDDNLIKLTERMPRVCKAVINAKGGYFEESKIWNMFWVISPFFVCYIIPYVFIQ